MDSLLQPWRDEALLHRQWAVGQIGQHGATQCIQSARRIAISGIDHEHASISLEEEDTPDLAFRLKHATNAHLLYRLPDAREKERDTVPVVWSPRVRRRPRIPGTGRMKLGT